MGKLPKGFSLQITGGATYAGFYVRFTKLSWRVCLGFIAITLFFYDTEPATTYAFRKAGLLNHPTTNNSKER